MKKIFSLVVHLFSRMKYKKILLLVFVLIAIAYQLSSMDPVQNFFYKFFPKKDAASDNGEIIPVKYVFAKMKKVTPTASVLGTIDYFEKVDITSKTSGKIEKILAVEGSKVFKGQIVVELERLPLEMELKKNEGALAETESSYRMAKEKLMDKRYEVEAKLRQLEKLEAQAKDLKSQLIKMKTTYEGKEKLYTEGGISKEEFNTIKTSLITTESQYITAMKDLEIAQIGYRDSDIKAFGYEVPADKAKRFEILVTINSRTEKAELEMAAARIKSATAAMQTTQVLLKECTIRTPITGYVALKNKNVGEEVTGGSAQSPDNAIMVIVDINKVYAKIDLREADVVNINEGQKMTFTADIYPNRTFESVVKSINPMIDSKTHTAQVKAIFSNKDEKFKPGMFVRAKIVIGKPFDAILVPSKSILPKEENLAWIFVVKKDRAFKIEVKTGNENDDNIEILTGLKEGDQVIIEKNSQLRDGSRIEPALAKVSDRI